MEPSRDLRARDSYAIQHTMTDSQMSNAFFEGVKICLSIDLYGQVITISTHCVWDLMNSLKINLVCMYDYIN